MIMNPDINFGALAEKLGVDEFDFLIRFKKAIEKNGGHFEYIKEGPVVVIPKKNSAKFKKDIKKIREWADKQ